MAGEARSVVVRLSMDASQAMQAAKDFGKTMEQAMATAEGKTKRAHAAMDQLGGTAGKLGLAAAAGLFAIERSTANFDEAMSHVAATGDDARASIDALREAAIEAGAKTAFSATEAAGGIENLEKAGVSAKDILGGGLSGALDLAAAGGLDVASAAEIAATALTQFKLEGADVPHVADLLAAAAGKAQGDVSDMALALKQSGLVAAQMGLSLEETTGTLAAFASAGLLGSDAGTSFRTMLLRLANPTNESAELMAQLGIQAYDTQGKFVGMAAVSGQLRAALQDKTQAERDSALATIFGSDAIRAASVLYDQGADGITRWTSNVNDAGYAADTAGKRMDNLKGDIEQFIGSLETALIGAGEDSQGALRGMVQGATKAVNVFNDMPPELQGTVTQMLAITAITGGAAWFGSKVVRGIADTREAMGDLGIEAGRTRSALSDIGRGAAGIIAVVTAADLLQASMDRLTNSRIDAGNLTRDLEALADGRVTKNLDSLFQTFQDIDDKWQANLNPLSWISSCDPSGAEAAEKNIKAIDNALAQMVESGSAETAAEAFERLAPTAEKAGVSTEKLAKLFPEYQTALDNAASTTESATDALGDYGVKARTVAGETKELNDEIRKSREVARGTAQEFVGLGDSLDDGKVSLQGWIQDLEGQASALRNFRRNAEEAADRGLRRGLIDALEEAGPAGALRMRQLANATDSELRRANRAWQAGQDEIAKYTDAVGGVPTHVGTDVEVNTFDAMRAVARLQNELSQVQSKDIEVRVHYLNFGNKLAGMASEGLAGPGHAAGGHVPSAAPCRLPAALASHQGD